jgi:hypothetical protein
MMLFWFHFIGGITENRRTVLHSLVLVLHSLHQTTPRLAAQAGYAQS